jgi:hypothetical protein
VRVKLESEMINRFTIENRNGQWIVKDFISSLVKSHEELDTKYKSILHQVPKNAFN